MSLRFVATILIVCGSFSFVRAAEADGDYARDIQPILKERCYACHGALKQKGGLRVDSVGGLLKDGDSGPAVVANKPADSPILDRIADPDAATRMPPEGPALTPKQIASVKAWIERGAKAPANDAPEEDPRNHWAFQQPVRPKVVGTLNPIDALLNGERVKRGLTAAEPTDKATLLRRVYLDLTGLPPTLEEQRAFQIDTAPEAYERVVDRLLATPQYGERYGRHWMDVWRYSDWYGRRSAPDVLNSYGQIWRWRDWIIRELNGDRGYDSMVRSMLAADEMTPTDDANLVATGFVVRNFYRWNYNNWMRDSVEHTSKAFLGLTFNCCHCHDHKYDPISQEDYFRFRAIFEPLEIRHDRWPGEADPGVYPKYNYTAAYPPIKSGMVRAYDEKPDALTHFYTGGDERNKVKDKPPIPPGVPKSIVGPKFDLKAIDLPPEAWYPGLKSFVRKEELDKRTAAIRAADAALKAATDATIQAVTATGIPDAKLFGALPAMVMAMPPIRVARAATAETLLKVAHAKRRTAQTDLVQLQARIAADDVIHLGVKGDVKAVSITANLAEREHRLSLALVAQAQATETNAPTAASNALAASRDLFLPPATAYVPISPQYSKTSSGRRAALANWITSPENPLTARVAANHIWTWHFGRPIVATPSNFGRNGKKPTHPELLDWLATELVRTGWKMKSIHRTIVTSQAYRMRSSGGVPANAKIDPDNVFLWQFPTLRVEAEVVRDSLLHVAGDLDVAIGGPELPQDQGLTSRRRSLYFSHHGEARMEFLELFDVANPCDAYVRSTSILPQQALAMSNSDLALRQSRILSAKLWKATEAEKDREAAFVAMAFERVLSRPAKYAERKAATAFLARQRKLFVESKLAADPHERSRENLIHALFNHSDFVTVR